MLQVPVENILPTKIVSSDTLRSQKFLTILASIRELGVIEPLAVFPEKTPKGKISQFILLDGHLRYEALKQLGVETVSCLVSTDDEGFTYNRQINRLSSIQEHKMILEAVKKGVSVERIAQVLNVNVERIIARQNLLDGIAPEVAELLKDRMVGQKVFAVLRKMKPMRQIEVAEMMNSTNNFTSSYADMLLVTTRTEQLVIPKKKPHKDATLKEIAFMEQEMEKLQTDYASIENTLGEDTLALVITKSYVARLMRNTAVAEHLNRYHGELFEQLMEAIAMDAITTDV